MGPEVQLGEWRMLGTHFRAISQQSTFRFTEAMSLSVTCADQEEVDRYWYGLLEGGGEESQCGWLKDAFGVWWQIVPAQLPALLADPDPARATAAREQMFTQQRIVIADLEAARRRHGRARDQGRSRPRHHRLTAPRRPPSRAMSLAAVLHDPRGSQLVGR